MDKFFACYVACVDYDVAKRIRSVEYNQCTLIYIAQSAIFNDFWAYFTNMV